jgi:hypothetical protein
VQGSSLAKRRDSLRFVVALAAAHIVTVGLVVFVLSEAAPALVAFVPRQMALLTIVVASVVGIVIDGWAANRRRWTLGVARQTPKRLQFLGEHAWVTPYAWGVDTGLVVTTYRVSFCSWLMLFLALTGVAPPWAGVVYGISFAIPLLVMTRLVKTRFHHPSDGVRPWSAVPVQIAGIGSMLLLAVVSVLAMGGG